MTGRALVALLGPLGVAIAMGPLGSAGAAAVTNEPALFPEQRDGKIGYVDRSGTFVIPPRFTEAHRFSCGLARVSLDPKTSNREYAFMDSTGRVVIAASSEHRLDFWDDLAITGCGDECWYMDRTGNRGVPGVFISAQLFGEGLAGITRRRDEAGKARWQVIDKSGAVVITQEYSSVAMFSQGLAGVLVDEKWGYIDRTGTMVIRPQFFECDPFSEGLAVVSARTDGQRDDAPLELYSIRDGAVDARGHMAIPFVYFDLKPFSEGLAVAALTERKYGFVDSTGGVVIAFQYHYAKPFSEGLAAVDTPDGYGYIDKTGAMVIPPQFSDAEPFSQGVATVYVEGEFHSIDNKGKRLVPSSDPPRGNRERRPPARKRW